MDDAIRFEKTLSLGDALRAMPLESPDARGWTVLAARMPSRRGPTRWPLALAAGLLALMLLPREVQGPNSPARASANPAAGQRVELAALMAESAQLERLVSAASDDGASSATAAAWSLELEGRLQSLDAALEANRDPAKQLGLWQQRVELLRTVASLETSRHYLASQGRNFDVALVSTY